MREITAYASSARLEQLLARERSCLVDFISALAEFDRDELWKDLGHTSLFSYCTRQLHLPKASAWRRVTACQLIQRFPQIVEMLRKGQLTLRSLAKIREVLTDENASQILRRAATLSEEQAELLALEYRPRLVPRETTTSLPAALPTPDALGIESGDLPKAVEVTKAVEVEREVIRPLTPMMKRLHVNISSDLEAKLAQVRSLLSHKYPEGAFEDILREALEVLIERELGRKAKLVKEPKSSRRRSSGRTVPAAVKRKVWQRDGGRCSWPVADGKVCGSTHQLEFDHDLEFSLGGPATGENIRLLCRFHNLSKAELHLGKSFMNQIV